MQLSIHSISDIGKIRKRNEDSYLEKDITDINGNKGILLVVADGMGGHKAGDVASKTLISDFENNITEFNSTDSNKLLNDLILKANKNIIELSKSSSEYEGMGTTCTAMIIINGKVCLGHVGDSRAYLIRKNKIRQLTKDHTVAEQMHNLGMITKDQLQNSPRRNMLLKAIGFDENLEVDLLDPMNISDNDVFLLCSDGLIEYVGDEELMSIVNLYEPEKACDVMVKTANKRGGRDNITVQIAKIIKKSSGNGIIDNIKNIIKT